LAIQHVVGDGTALATILRQSSAPWPRSQCLLAHQALDMVQTAAAAPRQQVVPDPPSTIRAVAADKALAHLVAKILVVPAAFAARPIQPGVEAASRDTERLAHQIQGPGLPVLRHEAEPHIDSFAK
jgi:hypothetical protein